MEMLVLEAVLRALLVSGSAAALACWIGPGAAQRWTGAALVVWLIPDLALSYGWREAFLPLIHRPVLRELAYAAMLAVKSASLSMILMNAPWFGQNAAGQWLWSRFSPARPWQARRAWRGSVPRFLLLALPSAWLCFHDFDWASRLGVSTWSVALFDAHAGGLPGRDTVARAAPSLLVSAAMMALMLHLGRKLPVFSSQTTLENQSALRGKGLFVLLVLGLLTMGYPLGRVLGEAFQGASLLMQQSSLLVDACLTLAWSGVAAGLALWLCRCLPRPWLFLLLWPGMLGALPLGLGLMALGLPNQEWGSSLFPVALILGWTLWVMPRACLLGWLTGHPLRSSAAFLANSSRDARLRWWYEGRRSLLWLSAVWFLVYTEVLLAAMLAPPGFAPVFARLYNLMHYGRGPLLSALLVSAYGLALLVQGTGVCLGNKMLRQKFDKT